MSFDNKVHLRVKKDANGWYQFSRNNFRLQLCWDTRRDWFFLTQYANKLGKKDFMKDFTEILEAMEKDNNQAIFSLYILPEVINWKIEPQKS